MAPRVAPITASNLFAGGNDKVISWTRASAPGSPPLRCEFGLAAGTTELIITCCWEDRQWPSSD